MKIHYRWEDEDQTLMLVSLEEGWTWEEYYAVVQQLATTIRRLGHPVDAIVKNSARIPFPTGSALSHLRQIMRLVPDNIGVIVLVSSNPFVKTINQVLFQLLPTTREIAELADTEDEARTIIAERRARHGR